MTAGLELAFIGAMEAETTAEQLCACFDPDRQNSGFETRDIGTDETEGRFAEVTLQRCLSCDRLWLRYFVEYEGFAGSGRWARGMIAPELASEMLPENAADYLQALPWRLFGGSYFEGRTGRGSGKMNWSI